MRDRSTLHLEHIEAFARWAETRGYVREAAKGVYEVLRLRKPGSPPLLYFQRLGGAHATAQGSSAVNLVRHWIRSRDEKPEKRNRRPRLNPQPERKRPRSRKQLDALAEDATREMGLDPLVYDGDK